MEMYFRMTAIYAIVNQKGGVGKTTTCVNAAAALAAQGQKVLLIDLDPQGNATTGSGVDKHAVKIHSMHILMKEASLKSALIEHAPAGYAVLPANSDLTAAEVFLLNKKEGVFVLKRALEDYALEESTHFDYILIDCPPSLNMLTLNALNACRFVIVPMQCEYYSLEGISDLLQTIAQLQGTVHPELEIAGVLRTMYDPRYRLSNEVSEQLQAHFGDSLFQTTIPRNVRLAEAPSHGIPIHMYDPHSRGALAYNMLAKELIIHCKEKTCPVSTV
jgi:chromosome partitioning protein